MKFLFLVEADENVELGIELEEVLRWFEEIERRGARLTGGRLQHTSQARRVSNRDGALVTDGPFAEAKEVIGGYWMIEVKSREEAIEWAKRCPASENEVIEIRQVQEMSDFPPDVQKAAVGFDAMQKAAGKGRK